MARAEGIGVDIMPEVGVCGREVCKMKASWLLSWAGEQIE